MRAAVWNRDVSMSSNVCWMRSIPVSTRESWGWIAILAANVIKFSDMVAPIIAVTQKSECETICCVMALCCNIICEDSSSLTNAGGGFVINLPIVSQISSVAKVYKDWLHAMPSMAKAVEANHAPEPMSVVDVMATMWYIRERNLFRADGDRLLVRTLHSSAFKRTCRLTVGGALCACISATVVHTNQLSTTSLATLCVLSFDGGRASSLALNCLTS
mmetsp:Transcript_74068/g.130714  ORF Transcript_74068/g.130714 Transcript_74068/m.130714 type:complete len:217 (+) Transcript_74068:2807-3457(+)